MWKDELYKLNGEMSQGKRLPRTFFTRDGLTVAKELLGKVLVHDTSLGEIRGIITEVESYMGVEDKGSHTYGGRRTERTEPMFHIGGTSYVYFTYGMYHCMNITTDVVDNPQAVLIRSVVPADKASQERMLKLRLEASLASIKKRKEAKGEEFTLAAIEGRKRNI
jgi:DNA-3-methyladenine glycosylase